MGHKCFLLATSTRTHLLQTFVCIPKSEEERDKTGLEKVNRAGLGKSKETSQLACSRAHQSGKSLTFQTQSWVWKVTTKLLWTGFVLFCLVFPAPRGHFKTGVLPD